MMRRFTTVRRSVVADSPPWALLIRLFFALGWLRAATEKLADPHWWSGAGILDFLDEHADATLDWYAPFIDWIVVAHLDVIVLAVVVLQVGSGLSLLTGRALRLGLAAGIFLNLNFVAAGAVNPSAFYIVAQGALSFWLIEARPSPASRRTLMGGVGVVVLLGLLSAPFVATLRPDDVIDDPAVMFLTFAALATVATIETIRRHTLRASTRRRSDVSIDPRPVSPQPSLTR